MEIEIVYHKKRKHMCCRATRIAGYYNKKEHFTFKGSDLNSFHNAGGSP